MSQLEAHNSRNNSGNNSRTKSSNTSSFIYAQNLERRKQEILRIELELQSRREEIDNDDKKGLLKYAITVSFIQMAVFLSLLLLLAKHKDKANECHEDMVWYLTYCMYYFGVAALRQLFVIFIVPFVKKPQLLKDRANCLFLSMDAILYTSLTIWGTKIISNEKAIECSES